MVLVLLCSVWWPSLPGTSVADGTYVKFGPGGLVPMRNEDVQLVRETVELEVARRHLLDADSRMRITVTYLFRNHSDRAVKVHMGFPVGLDFKEQYMQGKNHLRRSRHNPISRFKASVDGRRVAVRLVRSKKRVRFPVGAFRGAAPPNLIDRAHKMLDSEQPLFDRYHVWVAKFGPGQERTVVNRYRYDASAGVYFPINEVRYVLRTGAAWRGKIEQATIRLRLGDKGCISAKPGFECVKQLDPAKWMHEPVRFAADNLAKITPPNPTRRVLENGSVEFVWSLEDFEPDADVHLFYSTALATRRAIKRAIGDVVRTTKDPVAIRRARDTLLALYGLTNADPEVQARLAKKRWYVADPKMTRARLPNDPVLARTEAALRGLNSPPGGDVKSR